jgi:hypothetical protein
MRIAFKKPKPFAVALSAMLTAAVLAVPLVAVGALSSGCSHPGRGSGSDYCYDFSVVHETCRVGQATNWGCQNGREYKWTAGCLGWFEAYHSGRRLCFKSRLTDAGACSEGNSLPRGGQVPTPLEESVSLLRAPASPLTQAVHLRSVTSGPVADFRSSLTLQNAFSSAAM